eukprot:scaffold49850_cov42-Phaeocystis_antarctica.AAC.2
MAPPWRPHVRVRVRAAVTPMAPTCGSAAPCGKQPLGAMWIAASALPGRSLCFPHGAALWPCGRQSWPKPLL